MATYYKFIFISTYKRLNYYLCYKNNISTYLNKNMPTYYQIAYILFYKRLSLCKKYIFFNYIFFFLFSRPSFIYDIILFTFYQNNDEINLDQCVFLNVQLKPIYTCKNSILSQRPSFLLLFLLLINKAYILSLLLEKYFLSGRGKCYIF